MTSLDIYWATPAVFWPDSEAWLAAQKRELQDYARAQNTDLHVLSHRHGFGTKVLRGRIDFSEQCGDGAASRVRDCRRVAVSEHGA